MMHSLRCLLTLAASALVARAQPLLPSSPVSLDTLAAFQPTAVNWQLASDLAGDPRIDSTLTPVAGRGLLVNTPAPAAHSDLFTSWKHADLELDLDFLLPAGADSGVYLMGRYEVQLRDSWGVKAPAPADCGGIGDRWDDARGLGKEAFDGVAPRTNAGRAPGLWQHLHVEFQAPRFDATGKKIRNAVFVKVTLNDFVIHANAEISGPTRGAAFADEQPEGPLMIQGDRGGIALRRITYKRFDPAARFTLENLAFKLYAGESMQVGSYDATAPTREGPSPTFSPDTIDRTSKYAVVFTGALVVPEDGIYAFGAETDEPVRLLIDNQPAITPLDQGGLTVPLRLAQGRHAFRLDHVHGGWRPPSLQIFAEGPGLPQQLLTAARGRGRGREPQQLLIEPGERVRLQRGFVPFDPRKRLYAISVGTPAGIHYAYDFETAAILRVWRGPFLDLFESWDGRGEPQLAKPAGPAITFNAKPAVVLLERSAFDWPNSPELLWSSQGYILEPDGQPVFLAKLASLTLRDRIAPAADGHGLVRTLNFTGKNTEWQTWVLLAESDAITPQPGGRGYIVGDRGYYVDFPAGASVRPLVRTRNGRQQLVLPVGANAIGQPLVYSLVW